MALYDVSISEADLPILVQQWVVLFGILGLFLIVAAFRTVLQHAAIMADRFSIDFAYRHFLVADCLCE